MENEGLNEQEIKTLEELDGLQNALVEGEGPEEKRIKSLLDSTSDPSLKETLQDRLSEIKDMNSVDIGEVIERLEALGYSHQSVVRGGIAAIKQRIKWRGKNRTK